MMVGSRDKRKLTYKVKLKKGRKTYVTSVIKTNYLTRDYYSGFFKRKCDSEKYGDIEQNPPLYLGHYNPK